MQHALLVILCKIATPVLQGSKSAFAQIIALLLVYGASLLRKTYTFSASSLSEPPFPTHASHMLLGMFMGKIGHCV
jgi:hypothetical protein